MKQDEASQESAIGAWVLAWVLVVPLIGVLLFTKTARVFASMVWTSVSPMDDSSLRGVAVWLWGFTSLRVAGALVAAVVLQRLLFPRRPILILPIGAVLFSALALAVGLVRREGNPFGVIWHWAGTAYEQFVLIVACMWRDTIAVSAFVLALGLLLLVCSHRIQPWLVRTAQVLIAVACVLVGIDYVQEFGTGQATNTRVLLFALLNAGDVAVMVKQEATPYRIGVLVFAFLLPVVWIWVTRGLARRPLAWRRTQPWGLGAALVGAAGLMFPFPAFDANQRDTASTFRTLVRTAQAVPEDQIRTDAIAAYERTHQARWSSAQLALTTAAPVKPRNVVIVMIESMRAIATTIHTPGLATTPYLKTLAEKGVMVADMNAVIPRTAAAWVAILGGQYPLTNEGTAVWAAERREGGPVMRGLPGALKDAGYATSFFSPAHLHLLNDRELLEALGFESIFTGGDLARGAAMANYFGAADEVMVKPILEWTRSQLSSGKPFMTAVMTSVGHHPYEPPAGWKTMDFGHRDNEALERYYNCLRYIDGVLASLMQGYEELGVLKDTVFVFVGDHGQMFGEHGLKQSFNSVYQEGVQVPAVLYAPGLLQGGQVIAGPRQQIDILPTVAELLGRKIEGARLPGKSLFQPAEADRPMFFSSSIEWTQLAMRRGERKYIYSFERDPIAVFDLATDPFESKPIKSVDPAELMGARNAMIDWQVHAEISAYGARTKNHKPIRSWNNNEARAAN